jgi:hypothetical protein
MSCMGPCRADLSLDARRWRDICSAYPAVKEMMRESGMRPLGADNRRDDPFYAHFPELKTHLRDTAKGRRGDELRKIGENAGLFQYWDTKMRYAPTADIEDAWVESWRISAHDLVDRMGAL